MFSASLRSSALSQGPSILKLCSSKFSTRPKNGFKIAVLGACGHIGQPLSLLLKLNARVAQLAMYDIQYPQGVASDLSHVPTTCEVAGYSSGQLLDAVKRAHIVICAAGVPRKTGLNREEQFRLNSKVIKELAKSCAMMNPGAIYCIVTNPINSIVPLWCEIFNKSGILNESKVMGISNLGMMRANYYIAKEMGKQAAEVSCPVIGGHSGSTIVPVLSQCKPKLDFSKEQMKLVTHEIREAGAEIVEAKHGTGTVALSIAWSAYEFVDALLRAMEGEKGVKDIAFIKSDIKEAKYFSHEVELGPDGIAKNLGLPPLNEYERKLLDECLPTLNLHIKAGEGAATDTRPSMIPNAMVL